MRNTGHRGKFLLLLITFFAVKIFFDLQMLRVHAERYKELCRLAKESYETCVQSMKLCEKVTGKSCGEPCQK